MRKFTTMLCSIAFMISGILLVYTKSDDHWSYKTINATPPTTIAFHPINEEHKELITVHDTIRDTVRSTFVDVTVVAKKKPKKQTNKFVSEYKQKKKVFEPDTIPSQAKIDIDTLYVSKPVLIIPKTDTTTVAK